MKTQVKTLVALSLAALFTSAQGMAKSNQTAVTCTFPTPPAVTASQGAFDEYSWQAFISVNWPASTSYRGKADCTKALGESGTPVWQTYKTSNQVFLPDAQNPGKWNAGYGAGGVAHPLTQLNKVSNDDALQSHQEAVGGWLIDQNKNPTYFQMWVNEDWYDYVLNNEYYNKDNFSNSTRISLPNNATEIKSAWRILTANDDQSRYITQQSTVAEFNDKGEVTGTFKNVTLGLVGMHLIVKAKGYPQWIWATFEHVDNVPPSEYDASSGKVVSKPAKEVNYSYFNAAATNPNQSPCKQSNPDDCISFTTPNPLTRVTPIRDEAQAANTKYQQNSSVKSTALANYQLITTQWPTMPDNPGATNGNPTPTVSANTTMESYIQSSSNCMNCHGMATLPGTAAKSDYSFLFSGAQSASTNNK